MTKGLMVAINSLVLMGLLPVSSASLRLKVADSPRPMQVLRDGKSETTPLDAQSSGDSITSSGHHRRRPSKIENGKIAGDTLTFSFIHDNKAFQCDRSLRGYTISFDNHRGRRSGHDQDYPRQAAGWICSSLLASLRTLTRPKKKIANPSG